MPNKYETLLQEQFPFLTLFEYSGTEYLGIVQNYGKIVVSVYVYNKLPSTELKKYFLELGEQWWAESNRRVPINLFFKQDFNIFLPYVINFSAKEFNIISGQVVSLQQLNQRRVKRRRVQLVIKSP